MHDHPATKLAYTITEAHRAIGIGRTSLYNQINSGNLECFKACGRTLIPADALHAFVARARAAASEATAERSAAEQL